jgi:NAD(P)-dependent dehydrogenase (short-subunit alcohol dehydrogenase family)
MLAQDGLEFTFALNHMAYFVLTEGLREWLLASRPARIINTARIRTPPWISTIFNRRIPGLESLKSLETVQHPVYERARPPAARHGESPQIACIPACRYTLW